MKINSKSRLELENLGNKALDCTQFLFTPDGIYVIAERKGNIELVEPTVIKLDINTYRQSVMANLAAAFGLEIKMRPIQHQPPSDLKVVQ